MTVSNPSSSRVVITGMGAVSCLGNDATANWEAMREGRSGIRTLHGEWYDRFIEKWASRIGGQVDFDPSQRLFGREARRVDRFTQLALYAAYEAVAQSGIDFSTGDSERRGVVVGSGVGGIGTIEDGSEILFSRGPDRLSPMTVPRLMANAASGNIAITYHLRGPSSTHATACASSGHSIADAVHMIRRGAADVMLAGGAEAAVTALCVGAFMTMKALSTRNDDPAGASRPFDRTRDGFVLAEGAGIFVLESEQHAKARGAEILAEVLGCASSTDAHHITAPETAGAGASRSMRFALQDAGLSPQDIDYINAHGTSTPLGDAAEIRAVLSVFGDHARASKGGRLLMSSTKSVHGHTLGASGALEMVACIGAVRSGVAPPTINLENPDEGFDIDLVPKTAKERPLRKVMNNTFGFGGHNVTLVIGRYE